MQDDSVAAMKASDSRTGTVVANRYRLEHRLGAGGMGEVYAAKHVEIPRRFAVKLLRGEFTRDKEIQQRFRREAEAAAGLSSDHIVEISDFGYAEDDSPFLVMELLEGLDLRRVLTASGKLPVGKAVAAVTQACAGVAVAHEKGIVHRDLKPENLFLAQRGSRTTVKVLDFGIAKLRNQSLDTGAGRLLGTPAYMPPEQVRGDAGIDQRADVYALGVILYETLTGALPHPGEGQHEIITHVLFGEPTAVRALNPEVPEALAEIVHKALARAADDRFTSVAELARSLAPYVGSEPLSIAPTENAELRPTLPAQSSEDRPAPPSARARVAGREPGGSAPQPEGRSRSALGLALALVAVVLGGLIWSATRASHKHSVAPAEVIEPSAGLSPGAGPSPAPESAGASAGTAIEALSGPSTVSAGPAPPAPLAGANAPMPSGPPTMNAVMGAAGAHAARVRRAPRVAPQQGSAAVSEPAATPETETKVIEVRRGDRTIVFKRDNPLRSK